MTTFLYAIGVYLLIGGCIGAYAVRKPLSPTVKDRPLHIWESRWGLFIFWSLFWGIFLATAFWFRFWMGVSWRGGAGIDQDELDGYPDDVKDPDPPNAA